ncbi:MAG TPA: hypothetical protein VF532_03550 [Candidatus Angelobacter sp.]
MLAQGSKKQKHRTEYATCRDFRQIFTQDMAGLHLLAFLLTADQAKAEQCFVAGLDDAIKGNPVFREWARSWSKRAIVKRAIRMMAPAPEDPRPATLEHDSVSGEHGSLVQAVVALASFQRFVFIMAVLEGYSVKDCALLLGRTVRDVVAARTEAIQQVSSRQAVAGETVPSLTWKEFLPSADAA